MIPPLRISHVHPHFSPFGPNELTTLFFVHWRLTTPPLVEWLWSSTHVRVLFYLFLEARTKNPNLIWYLSVHMQVSLASLWPKIRNRRRKAEKSVTKSKICQFLSNRLLSTGKTFISSPCNDFQAPTSHVSFPHSPSSPWCSLTWPMTRPDFMGMFFLDRINKKNFLYD